MLLHLSIILLSNSRLVIYSYILNYEPNSHDFTGLRIAISIIKDQLTKLSAHKYSIYQRSKQLTASCTYI